MDYDLVYRRIDAAESRFDILDETLASTIVDSIIALLAKPARLLREWHRHAALRDARR